MSDGSVSSPIPSLAWYDELASSADDYEVSISTSFHPGSRPSPDTILLSTDGVLFYVHCSTVMSACPEIFKDYISSPLTSAEYRATPITLDTTASQLNIILHLLHNISPAANSPDFDTVVASINHMPKYGMSPQLFIRQTTPFFEFLLSHAPLRPLDLYALGAFHSIDDLCISASSYLLSYNLANITDQMAERMGAVYLKKLMLLHLERSRALRNIILQTLHPHAATRECSFEDQRKLTRAWALVGAYLVWDGKPGARRIEYRFRFLTYPYSNDQTYRQTPSR